MNLWIIAAIFLLSGLLLLRYAAKLVSKLIGLILLLPALLLLAYLFKWGPFKVNYFAVSTLEKNYCADSTASEENTKVCRCLLLPYKEFIATNYSPTEQIKIEESHVEAAYVFHTFQAQKNTAADPCALTEEERSALYTRVYRSMGPAGQISKLLQSLEGIKDSAILTLGSNRQEAE
jgi:hypothetical protein